MTKQMKNTKTDKKMEALKVSFQEAIENNNNKEQIRIFDEMDALKLGQRTEEDKLNEIESYKQSLEIDKIVEKINGFHKNVEEGYQKRANQLMKEINKNKQEYINTLSEVRDLNNEYENQVNHYFFLMNNHGLAHNVKEDTGRISFELTSKLTHGRRLLSVPETFTINEYDINKELRNK